MDKQKRFRLPRMAIQIFWTALTNGFAQGFIGRKIYTGDLKRLCVPGLNCYSCPGALGACPIGAFQAVITDRKFSFSYYVVGILLLFGALLGRVVCGFLCPFGLVQDLLYKIPFPWKRKSLPGHKVLVWLKYAVLIVFVVILPLTIVVLRTGVPAFCKYICPSGTLMGALSLVPGNDALAAQTGTLFWWKVGVLGAVALLSVVIYRPFCKYLCPLGAIYSLFNRVSAIRLKVDPDTCTRCGKCARVCKMEVDPVKCANAAECIRCGDCVKACPVKAIAYDAPWKRKKNR